MEKTQYYAVSYNALIGGKEHHIVLYTVELCEKGNPKFGGETLCGEKAGLHWRENYLREVSKSKICETCIQKSKNIEIPHLKNCDDW